MDGILWTGRSKNDGSDIAAVLTGSGKSSSKNTKTGGMQQIWILKSDVKASDAIYTGADKSVCGDCPNRGIDGKQRACYVNIFRGPNNISNKLINGGYEKGAISNDRPTRIGAYGDPGLLPINKLESITKQSKGWTGYTHMWRKLNKEYAKYLMASTSNEEDAKLAIKEGWRTFMALPKNASEPPAKDFINCPASEEAGHKTTCENCLKCHGGKGKSIWIRAHGRGAKYLK